MKLIAVYGTLRPGEHNYRVSGNAPSIGTAQINGFQMFTLGGYPGVVPGNEEDKIIVDILQVEDEFVPSVYRLEGYNGVRGHSQNNFYDTVDIETTINGEKITAEMFIYKGNCHVKNRIENGDWKEYRATNYRW